MGPRDDDGLNAAAEDEALRRLLEQRELARFAEPPPGLTAKVLAQLPDLPPAAAARAERLRHIRNRFLAVVVVVAVLLLQGFGAWGVLADSSGPAALFGDVGAGAGRALLMLTLAAKPLVNLLLAPGLPLLALFMLLLAGIAALWW